MHRHLTFVAVITLAACQPGPAGPAGEPAGDETRALEALVALAQPEATPQLEALRARLGPNVLARFRDGRPKSLFGLGLGGVQLKDPLDEVEAERAVLAFFRQHADVYGLSSEQIEALEVVEVQKTDRLGLQLQQRHQGLRVVEGRFFVGFTIDGRLSRIVGRPVPQEDLPEDVTTEVSVAQARRIAGALVPEAEPGHTELVVSEALGLGFEAHVDGPTVESTAWVDARSGQAKILRDDIGHLVKSIPVRRYRHGNGSRTETVNEAPRINVDVEPWTLPKFGVTRCLYRLQRLGSGRARIWQGFGEGTTPSFSQTTFMDSCSDSLAFTEMPGATADRQFNEQHTYWWAQLFKTDIDNWGRRPNSYGHYPVDSGRGVNVEIVVNGSSSREQSWCNLDSGGVQHGCFRSRARRSWFNGHPSSATEVPTVFLFNVGNNSYHFNGIDNTASYAIIAHEVGHFISWSYGSWSGPLERSLNEGFSMVLPGLMAKDRWSAVGYFDAHEVSTGGPRWMPHVNSSDLQAYDGRDCSQNEYRLARPFVQAMWHLMNNEDESWDPIWSSDEAAIRNTADRVMDAMHDLAGVSTVEWDDVSDHIYLRTFEAIYIDGTEQGVLPSSGFFSATMTRMLEVLETHGLDGTCL